MQKDNNIIDFTQKVNERKEKQQPVTNCFTGIINMLYNKISLLDLFGENAMSLVQNYSQKIGKVSNDFVLSLMNQEDFSNAMDDQELIPLDFGTKEENGISYHIVIEFDMENVVSICRLERRKYGKIEAFYNEDEDQWYTLDKLDFSRKLKKILDSKSPESDILNALMYYSDIGEDEYYDIKRKYKKLFSLYNKTCNYMNPTILQRADGEMEIHLEPKDSLRHGFLVTEDDEDLVLEQYLNFENLERIGYDIQAYEWFGNCYINDVGRTNSINVMKHLLYRLANRYTENDIFTIPISMKQYVESRNLKTINRHSKHLKLTREEFMNLKSLNDFIRKNL